jgi:superfamily II DNA or RNA helicase
MKKTLKVSDIINNAQNMTKYTQVGLDDAQQRAVNAVTTVIGSGGLGVGVGPPGTGKTVVFTIAQSIEFDRIDKDEVMVYIAPTNRLVEESATRASALLLRKGSSEEDLKASIRVYGSWFKAEPLNQDVKLVFTTPYQPSMLKELLRIKKTIHIMVDEASTTPLHGPFIALSMGMARALEDKRIDWLESFSVIGDPMQAIAEGYSFHE